jgi:hypothetical protein
MPDPGMSAGGRAPAQVPNSGDRSSRLPNGRVSRGLPAARAAQRCLGIRGRMRLGRRLAAPGGRAGPSSRPRPPTSSPPRRRPHACTSGRAGTPAPRPRLPGSPVPLWQAAEGGLAGLAGLTGAAGCRGLGASAPQITLHAAAAPAATAAPRGPRANGNLPLPAPSRTRGTGMTLQPPGTPSWRPWWHLDHPHSGELRREGRGGGTNAARQHPASTAGARGPPAQGATAAGWRVVPLSTAADACFSRLPVCVTAGTPGLPGQQA